MDVLDFSAPAVPHVLISAIWSPLLFLDLTDRDLQQDNPISVIQVNR
jgi:hypothetical protein